MNSTTGWQNALRATFAKEVAPGWRDAELDWYVNHREGDMGVRGLPLEPGVGADPTTHDGISGHQVKAATRARVVDVALLGLAPLERLLLLAAHVRLSPNAHKDKHAAHGRFVAQSNEKLLAWSLVFRNAWQVEHAADRRRGRWQ